MFGGGAGGQMSGSMGDQFKVYITLRKNYESDVDYKRLMIMINRKPFLLLTSLKAMNKIADLKRKIEKEFVDLFPNEPPFIVAKLEDEYGYSLSNSSLVQDFLKYGKFNF